LSRTLPDHERAQCESAPAASTGAGAGGELGRDAHDRFAACEQEPLECAGDVPAVLDRPHPLAVMAARPDQQRVEGPPPRRDRLLAEQPPGRRIDGRDGVRALMRVRADHDHPETLPFAGVLGPDRRRTLLSRGAGPRFYQVTPEIPSGGGRHNIGRSHAATESQRVSPSPPQDLPAASDATARPRGCWH
jgi:hypothetical protein